jgi:hypothetical protein
MIPIAIIYTTTIILILPEELKESHSAAIFRTTLDHVDSMLYLNHREQLCADMT